MLLLGSALAAAPPPLARTTGPGSIIGFLVIAALLVAYRQFVLKRQLRRFEKPTQNDREADEEDGDEDHDEEGDSGAAGTSPIEESRTEEPEAGGDEEP